jgi:hypothetical protein
MDNLKQIAIVNFSNLKDENMPNNFTDQKVPKYLKKLAEFSGTPSKELQLA